MSDANRTQVGIVEESVVGTSPTSPAFNILRITGANLQYATKTEISKELRSDRQVTDVIRVGYEPAGTIPFEMSHGSFDRFLEGALFSTLNNRWAPSTSVSAVDGSTGTYTEAGATFAAGDLVRASGFSNSANNGVFVATSGSGTTVVTGAGRATEAAPPTIARLKKVGVQGGSGVIAATTTGLTGVPALGLLKGEWIKVGGAVAGTQFAGATANGWYRLSADQAGGVLTCDVFPNGTSVGTADAGAGKTIDLFVGDFIRNGTVSKSYTIESQFQDLTTPEYHYYSGMRLGKLTLQMQSQTIVTASAEFMGMTASIATARQSGASDVLPLSAFDVMAASNAAGQILENGAKVAGPNYVVGSEVVIDNTLRRQNAVASEGSIGVGVGRCMVSGKLSTYYGDETILQRLRNNTASGYNVLVVAGDDVVGRSGLMIDVPRIKFLGGDPTVPGVDTDRMLDLGFQGLRHPVLGYTVHIQKFEGLLGT